MCGKFDSAESPVVPVIQDLCLCTDCIQFIDDQRDTELRKRKGRAQDKKSAPKPIPTPHEIKEFLDQYVIGQDEAKKYLSVAVYNHYKRINQSKKEDDDDVDIEKSNVVLVGPTGTGKTLLAKSIAKLLDVPFTIVDATVLTEAGYVGEDIESLLTRLLQACDYDVEKAERGIIFIDEIDKVAGRSQSGGPDVSREGVQRDILPIVEGCTVNTKYGPVKTDHMLFIAAGAFHVAKVTDLIPELQGRFPVQVSLKPLTEADFRSILTQPENALIKQYQALMGVDDVELTFTEDALCEMAHIAAEMNDSRENIGARRLHTLMEELLDEVAFSGGESGPENIEIDGAYVRDHLMKEVKQFDIAKHII